MAVQLGRKPVSDDRDLTTRDEIAEMVRRFYADVAQDDLLGPLFNDVAQVDWSEHLPKLTAFWSRALLGESGYEGNPYRQHMEVHEQSAFTTAHFQRWLQLFDDTLSVRWSGPNVDRARFLAQRVATVHCRQLVGVELELTDPIAGPGGSAEQYHRRDE